MVKKPSCFMCCEARRTTVQGPKFVTISRSRFPNLYRINGESWTLVAASNTARDRFWFSRGQSKRESWGALKLNVVNVRITSFSHWQPMHDHHPRLPYGLRSPCLIRSAVSLRFPSALHHSFPFWMRQAREFAPRFLG